MITQMQERPAFVRFELRPIEDRNASIAAGHYVAKDTEYAIIVPVGGNTEVEREADEWFIQLEQRNDQFLRQYRDKYEAWKKGVEVPLNGKSLREWPVISPAQLANCLGINVYTVEDLAALPDSGLQRLGMGARSLQEKAKAWLEAANNQGGKLAEQISALSVQLETLIEQNTLKDQQIAELKARLDAEITTPRTRKSA